MRKLINNLAIISGIFLIGLVLKVATKPCWRNKKRKKAHNHGHKLNSDLEVFFIPEVLEYINDESNNSPYEDKL